MQGFELLYSESENPVTTLNITKSPPGPGDFGKYFNFERKISETELNELQMDSIPGFRLQWNYNQEVMPDSQNIDYRYTYAPIELRR